jgi:hypothetical protein
MLISPAITFVLVTVMVTGLGPQLKVTLPPPVQALDGGEPVAGAHPSAVFKAASVQLAGEPFPTTAAAWTAGGDHATATSSTASVRATTARIMRCLYPA